MTCVCWQEGEAEVQLQPIRKFAASTMLRPLYSRERHDTHCTGRCVGLRPAWKARKISPPTVQRVAIVVEALPRNLPGGRIKPQQTSVVPMTQMTFETRIHRIYTSTALPRHQPVRSQPITSSLSGPHILQST